MLEVNDSVVIDRSRPIALKGVAKSCEKFCLRNAKMVITITEDFKQKLGKVFPESLEKILVLPNGISRFRFEKIFDKAAIKKRLGVEGYSVIGAAGQFLPWHGINHILEQMAPFAIEHRLFFLFIGDGPVRKEILELAEKLGIQKRVIITGMVPIADVPEYLASLDIAVIPMAAQHASPMKLMEYMGMALPIVAPALESIQEVIQGKDLVEIFSEKNYEGMRGKILKLIENPKAAKDLGLRAQQHIFSTLTWTIHAEKILKII